MATQCNSVTINRIRSDSHFVYHKEVLVVVSLDNGLIVSNHSTGNFHTGETTCQLFAPPPQGIPMIFHSCTLNGKKNRSTLWSIDSSCYKIMALIQRLILDLPSPDILWLQTDRNRILLYKLQCFTRISTTEKCGI